MKKQGNLKIINNSTGTLIGDKIKYAGTFFLRLKGLLGCTFLEPGAGLLLYPCSSVHSFGMKISIDVLFLDENLRVLRTVPWMKPGLTARQKGARFVLELKAGTIERLGIKTGDILNISYSENSR